MSPHHYLIHPSIPCSAAIHHLAGLAGLTVVEEHAMEGAGQRDFFLRHKSYARQTIGVGMIVKNEERDLPAALESADAFADTIVIIDTGSTDNTLSVVRDFCLKNFWRFADRPTGSVERTLFFIPYTGASTRDSSGDWKLNSFSKARNIYVEALDSMVDWLFWLDADDIILQPGSVRALTLKGYDAYNFSIVNDAKNPATSFAHMRLWRTRRGVTYKGACHEYPTLAPGMKATDSGLQILHRWDPPTIGEISETRNLRILKREYAEGDRSSRTLFYLANSYRDCQQFEDAAKIYREYLSRGEGWHDEKVFAHLYLARCYRFMEKPEECVSEALRGLALDRRFSELWMEAAYAMFILKDERMPAMCHAAHQPMPKSNLFLERNKYQDQPWRMLAVWHENKGEVQQAFDAYQKVLEYVPGDADMQAAVRRLTEAPEIHILRPGAAGDILCVLQNLPALREKHGEDSSIVLHVHPMFKELASLSPEVDEVRDHTEYPAGTISLIGYPLAKGWPNCTMEKHLSECFGDELGVDPWPWAVSLKTPKNPIALKRYVTLHVKAGWSPYKEWPFDRWEQIVWALTCMKIDVVQVGGPNEPTIPGAIDAKVHSFAESLAIIKGAAFHMGIDSWSNHATAIHPVTPALILFGSTSPQEFGYPHARNLYKGLPCQPCHREYPAMTKALLPACPFDTDAAWGNDKHPCLNDFTVGEVWAEVQELIRLHLK